MSILHRKLEVITRKQNEKAKEKLSYVKHAITKGHNENAFAELLEACEMLHDAIETLQMQIDQIQTSIDR